MCNFKSAIVLRDLQSKRGYKLLLSPWTEHHSELELIFKLKEGVRLNYAKVEFSPPDLSVADKVETYKLKIDEDRTPDWFDDEMKESVKGRMSDYIKSIIVKDEMCLLIGGQFILSEGAKVEVAKECVIAAMCGGTMNAMCGGTMNEMCGGTMNAMRGGTMNAMRGAATIVKDNRAKEGKK